MTSLRMERLALSIWPFILIAPGETLGAMLIKRTNPAEQGGLRGLLEVSLVVGLGLVLAAACLALARFLIARSRSSFWRGIPVAVVIYISLAVLTGLLMVLLLVDRGPGGQPALLSVLYMVSRPVIILIIAVVVQLVRDGVAVTRTVDEITQDQLLLVRQTNEMIEAAERDLRAESLRMFAVQVARPLRRILRDGPDLDNDDLADRLEEFIEVRLRPMAHVLHPVSVRLGLIPAMRSLNPEISVDATRTVERMDADGTLLDDDVRLQLYRWIRSGLSHQGPSRAALVVRGRDLEVSLHPQTRAPVDAVQSAAGLRLLGPGLVAAPLRGQVVEVALEPDRHRARTSGRARYRLRELLTVPLPIRLLVVVLLSVGASPYQFVLYRWSPSAGTVLATLASALAPVAVVLVLDRLPPPRPTILGAWRVVGEWLAISAAAAFALVAVGTAYSVFPPGTQEWGLTLFRMSYRFGIPGLMVTLAYGLVVAAQRRLKAAEDALATEDRRRIEILGQSRQLDRDVAEALHRNVQGRLAAAVVLLRLGQRDQAWAQVVEMASVEIPWLLERMGDSPEGRVLLWDPPVGLNVIQLGDLPVDQQTFGLLRRAVGEVAVNAVRHGGASTLLVAVEVEQGRCRLICEDNGSGIRGPVVAGLGSRLLDETVVAAGGSWSIDSSVAGCTVVLEVPLDVNSRGLASSGV